MVTGESLLAAIVRTPDDNDLRLVYADWLLTQGEPQGELIHLSCQVGRDDDERHEIAGRVSDLEKQRARALGITANVAFDRGFIVAVNGHVPQVTTSLALAAQEPLVDRLHLTIDGQRDRVQLARPTTNAVLARAGELGIRGLKAGNTRYGRGPIGDLRSLAATPFTRLRSLEITQLRVEPLHIIELLVAMEAVPTLTSLQISTRMPADELARVSPAVARLRTARPTLELSVT